MTSMQFVPTVGHQHFEQCVGTRHLMQGPIVPEGEIWTLKLIATKNNMRIETCGEFVEEVSVCIFIPPRPTSHENPPPGTWVMLQNSTNIFQYEAVKWEGYLELRAGTQLGAWFRGAKEGDMLELNAIWDVEVIRNGEPLQSEGLTKEWDESGLGKVAQC